MCFRCCCCYFFLDYFNGDVLDSMQDNFLRGNFCNVFCLGFIRLYFGNLKKRQNNFNFQWQQTRTTSDPGKIATIVGSFTRGMQVGELVIYLCALAMWWFKLVLYVNSWPQCPHLNSLILVWLAKCPFKLSWLGNPLLQNWQWYG